MNSSLTLTQIETRPGQLLEGALSAVDKYGAALVHQRVRGGHPMRLGGRSPSGAKGHELGLKWHSVHPVVLRITGFGHATGASAESLQRLIATRAQKLQ